MAGALRFLGFPGAITVTLVLGLHMASARAQDQATGAEGWPRQFQASGRSYTIYQPQVESWQGNQLKERSAVAVEGANRGVPLYGVIWVNARTEVEKSQRQVTLLDLQITKVSFPTAENQVTAYKQDLEQQAPAILSEISLDRLRASLAITANESKRKVNDLRNDPPQIFFSDRPASLILIDGEPVLRETEQEGILRIVNTRALLVLNKADGHFLLRLANQWFKANQVSGPWGVAEISPTTKAKLEAIRQGAQVQHEVDAEENSSSQLSSPPVQVFVSTTPAELIQSRGTPNYEPIADTELLYVTNSPDHFFLDTAEQNHYVTLSGRWFRASTLKGPWTFVPADRLPHDFARIPENHPQGEILASVAGTPDAREAAIANEIPQTATVDRNAAKLTVHYDGAPQFAPISGSNLQYASNTSTPVIRVNGQAFYAVENGVWFVAPTPSGPWVVAADVPSEVYSIPPSSPVYNVTYAYVYGASPNYVYVGYLPDYLGSYVTPSGVVVYGTGYYYRPWVGHAWYGWPYTYGFGLAWGFGFGWTFRPVFFGAPVYHPWWGPWHHYWGYNGHPLVRESMTINHINVYRGWSPGVVQAVTPVHRSAERSTLPLQHGQVRVTPGTAARSVKPNNVYATPTGEVYRHNGVGWEAVHSSGSGAGGSRTTAPAPAKYLDQ